jgi:microcystin-dependent protein
MANILRTTNGFALVAFAAATAVTPAQGCMPDPYMGSVCYTAYDFCPRGYVRADGRLLSVSEFTAVFALLGNTFGGDGRTSFGAPDLRGREAIGFEQRPGLAHFSRGELVGQNDQVLVALNLPAHTHRIDLSDVMAKGAVKALSADGDDTSPVGHTWSEIQTQTVTFYATSADATMKAGIVAADISPDSATTGPTPANTSRSFPVLGPQLGLTTCLAVDGVFPQRP